MRMDRSVSKANGNPPVSTRSRSNTSGPSKRTTRVRVIPTSCCMDGRDIFTTLRDVRSPCLSTTPTTTSVVFSSLGLAKSREIRLYPMYTSSPVAGHVLACAVMLSSQ